MTLRVRVHIFFMKTERFEETRDIIGGAPFDIPVRISRIARIPKELLEKRVVADLAIVRARSVGVARRSASRAGKKLPERRITNLTGRTTERDDGRVFELN